MPIDDLLTQLEVIEQQPLGARAEAYAAVHADLTRRLDATPGEARPAS